MHRQFQQNLLVAAPLALVRDQIAALRHDIPAHDRYVVDATLLRSRSDGSQSIDDYAVLDRIGPRPIALTIRYRTRITWDDNNGTVIYATNSPSASTSTPATHARQRARRPGSARPWTSQRPRYSCRSSTTVSRPHKHSCSHT
ncbi:hypothetical protein [Nocardia sp. NPDC059239]|uniref:hypothetical protein n=1 Tax=Nocardia sp. NPDC059239 TaxID=3346785 RepID=UPI0036BD21F4